MCKYGITYVPGICLLNVSLQTQFIRSAIEIRKRNKADMKKSVAENVTKLREYWKVLSV